MSEAWRNNYDSWKLATPPWYEDEDNAEARENAEAAAFNARENEWSDNRES